MFFEVKDTKNRNYNFNSFFEVTSVGSLSGAFHGCDGRSLFRLVFLLILAINDHVLVKNSLRGKAQSYYFKNTYKIIDIKVFLYFIYIIYIFFILYIIYIFYLYY